MRLVYSAKGAAIKREKLEQRIQFVSMKEGDMIQRHTDNKFSVWYTSLVVTKLISLIN